MSNTVRSWNELDEQIRKGKSLLEIIDFDNAASPGQSNCQAGMHTVKGKSVLPLAMNISFKDVRTDLIQDHFIVYCRIL